MQVKVCTLALRESEIYIRCEIHKKILPVQLGRPSWFFSINTIICSVLNFSVKDFPRGLTMSNYTNSGNFVRKSSFMRKIWAKMISQNTHLILHNDVTHQPLKVKNVHIALCQRNLHTMWNSQENFYNFVDIAIYRQFGEGGRLIFST